MELFDYLRRLFAYDDWANREVLRGFDSAGATPARSLRLMAHVLGTEYVWYSRIRQEPSPLAVWPQLNLAECEDHAVRLPQTWSRYLDNLSPEQLSAPLSYKNTKGESWTNSVQDILMHVVMHSVYHRGQIAADMRAAGHTPAYTDFIHGVRQNRVK